MRHMRVCESARERGERKERRGEKCGRDGTFIRLNLSAALLEGAVLTVLMSMGLWANTRSKSKIKKRMFDPITRISQCDEVGSSKINSNSHMNPVSGAQIALFFAFFRL